MTGRTSACPLRSSSIACFDCAPREQEFVSDQTADDIASAKTSGHALRHDFHALIADHYRISVPAAAREKTDVGIVLAPRDAQRPRSGSAPGYNVVWSQGSASDLHSPTIQADLPPASRLPRIRRSRRLKAAQTRAGGGSVDVPAEAVLAPASGKGAGWPKPRSV